MAECKSAVGNVDARPPAADCADTVRCCPGNSARQEDRPGLPGWGPINISTRTSSPVPASMVRPLGGRAGPSRELTRTFQMKRSEAIRCMLADPRHTGNPWQHNRGEDQFWF
jgi:hypothetical protein